MKIAITGANGFVGSNLIKDFQACGNEVFALIRAGSSTALLPPATSKIEVNYQDIDSLLGAVNGMDAIIHNAGKTKALNHTDMLNANLGITHNVIAAVNSASSPLQLVYISSQAASKPSQKNQPITESEPSSPLSSYGISKLAAEQAIIQTCQKPWTIIRPCSVYGCGDRDFLTLFKLAKLGLNFTIGRQDRLLNMIHISQLAQFIRLCLTNPQAQNQIFFASDGLVYRQSEIQKAIAAAMQKKTITISIPELLVKVVFNLGDALGKLLNKELVLNREKLKEILAESWLADPAKAQNLLHWKPEARLQEFMKETAECYRKLGWL